MRTQPISLEYMCLPPRTDVVCRRLLVLLAPFTLGLIATDEWGSCIRQVPSHLHLVGKIFTQCIERHHLNLRTHIKHLTRKRFASLDP